MGKGDRMGMSRLVVVFSLELEVKEAADGLPLVIEWEEDVVSVT